MENLKQMHRKMRRNEISSQQWWDFIEGIPAEEVAKVTKPTLDASDRLRAYLDSDYYRNKIRKYCFERLYTDCVPYEVVRVISSSTIEIREMDTELVTAPKLLSAGGFAGNYDNYSQEWKYTSNEAYQVIRIKRTKKGWGSGRFIMSDKPYKHYDYNF